MTEVICLGDPQHHAAPAEASSLPPPQRTETDPATRCGALYDMLRILGRTVRTGEMRAEEKTEFALAALKVLGPGWVISRSG
jgi:hypothetical protein